MEGSDITVLPITREVAELMIVGSWFRLDCLPLNWTLEQLSWPRMGDSPCQPQNVMKIVRVSFTHCAHVDTLWTVSCAYSSDIPNRSADIFWAVQYRLWKEDQISKRKMFLFFVPFSCGQKSLIFFNLLISMTLSMAASKNNQPVGNAGENVTRSQIAINDQTLTSSSLLSHRLWWKVWRFVIFRESVLWL